MFKIFKLVLFFGLIITGQFLRAQKAEMFVQTGHTGSVNGVAYSPNGKTIATGGSDYQIKLWDADSGQELRTLNGHDFGVNAVAFSPDGKTLASGGDDKTVRLWDVISGRELKILTGHSISVHSCKFSADGKKLVSASMEIIVWDVEKGTKLNSFGNHTEVINSVDISPDGKLIASASNDKTIKLWTAATGKELKTLKGHDGTVKSVAFSPDGKMLASTGGNSQSGNTSKIKLWDAATGKELKSLVDDVFSADALAFSPDGKILASGGGQNKVNLWNVNTGQKTKTIQYPTASYYSGVTSLAFSPDGKKFIWGSQDSSAIVFDTVSGNLSGFRGRTATVNAAAFSPDGKMLVFVSDDHKIKLWDIAGTGEIKTFPKTVIGEKAIVFSPDGKTIISGGQGGDLTIWNALNTKEIKNIKAHEKNLKAIAFSPDGKFFASASEDKIIKLWDAATFGQLNTFVGHTESVESIAFSPDSKVLASGSGNSSGSGKVKLWNIADGKEVASPDAKKWQGTIIESVGFSPDSKILVSESESDGLIKFWDAANGNEIKSFAGFNTPVRSISFTESGEPRILRSLNETLKLWDAVSGMEITAFAGYTGAIDSADVSRDGKVLAVGAKDGSLLLWDVVAGKELKMLAKQNSRIYSSAFSADGKIFAAPDGDNSIKLWSVETGKEIKAFGNYVQTVFSLKFSTDGTKLAAGYGNGEIKVWDAVSGQEIKSFAADASGVYNSVTSLAFSPDGKLLASGGENYKIKLRDIASGKEIRTLSGDNFSFLSSVSALAFSPDSKTILSGSNDKYMVLWNAETGEKLKLLKSLTPAARSDVLSEFPHYYKNHRQRPTTPDGQFQIMPGRAGGLDLYDVRSGKLLASIIAFGETDLSRLTPERLILEKDWAIVTPDGLFDGTPPAWKGLAWRLDDNTFSNAPVEAFFKEFYRPELLRDILAGNPIDAPTRDLSKIDIRQPIIKISEIDGRAFETPNEISTDKKIIKVKIEITDNMSQGRQSGSSGAGDVRLFRNNSLVKLWKKSVFELTEKEGCKQIAATTDSPKKAICETDVQITSDKNEFTAYGFNHDNVKSTDATVTVKGDFPKAKGTMYILAVGVNEYANQAFNLKYAVPDVESIGNELTLQQSKLSAKPYAETKVITLTDKQATKANFVKALKRFSGEDTETDESNAELSKIKPTQPEDALIIYFAGHGLANKDRFYLIPHDGIPTGFSRSITDSSEQQRLLTQGKSLSDQSGLDQLYKQSISDIELEELLETVNAGKLMMVIDACNSGQALEAEEKRRGPMNSRGLAQLAYEKGINILTASQSFQAALEATKLNHGLLTYALLEGMTKGDANGDKLIIDREWLDYGVTAVPQLQIAAQNQRLLVQNKESTTSSKESKSELQTPRVFYRRERDVNPLIIALR